MALGIYLGGTTGAADGTLEVPGDGIGVTLGAIGSVGTLHIRASSGKQNAEQVTVNAPTDCQVAVFPEGPFGDFVTYGTGTIQDVNVPIYVKRVSGTTASTTGGTTTPRLALITEETIATPFAAWSDDFATLDSERWATETAGSGTAGIEAGIMSLVAPAAADAAMLILKQPVDLSEVRTYTSVAKVNSGSAVWFPLRLVTSAAQPAPGSYGVYADRGRFWFYRDGLSGLVIAHIDANNATRYWTGGAWNTTYGQATQSLAASTYYQFIIETDGTQIRGLVKNATGSSTILTTGWVALTALKAYSNPIWVIAGEELNDNWAGTGAIDSFAVS